MKKALTIAVFLWALPILSQSTTGELRLTITGPNGLASRARLRSSARATSIGIRSRRTEQGVLDAKRLPYGIYQLQIRAQGFAQDSEPVDIRSALPLDRSIRLKLARCRSR